MDNTSSMYLYVKLNWDANRFLPVESKDCMNSASYEYRNMSARRGAQFVPMGKVISKPKVCQTSFPNVDQMSWLRSRAQNLWYHQKDLVIRNAHAKY